jgi:spore coat polysaccharide biosynthesis protein SpsF
MAILAIVQARMSSSRLPGKVLMEIEGIPMITRQIQRINQAKLVSTVIVATSHHLSDDPLVEYLENSGVKVQRGPLDDVLKRYIEVLDHNGADSFVRLTADCPLTDPEVIDHAIELFLESDFDYVSNTLDRTYPRGLDVEVAKSKALIKVAKSNFDPMAREHVTYGIYMRPDLFSLGSLTQGTSRAKFRWTVDNQIDMDFARNVYRHFLPTKPDFRQQDVLEWLTGSPEFVHLESEQ